MYVEIVNKKNEEQKMVKKYDVYQIMISPEIHDFVNSNGGGHKGASEKYPIYEANMRLRHPSPFDDSADFKDDDFQHYTKVCEVKKDAGLTKDGESWKIDHLADVFALLNGSYYNHDTEEDEVFDAHVSGYKTTERVVNGETITVRMMHSLSVGDIVHDLEDNTYHIVCGFGFQDVTQDVQFYDLFRGPNNIFKEKS